MLNFVNDIERTRRHNLNLKILGAAFKFARRVHFALRRKMLKPPIARLPAIKLHFINRLNRETQRLKQRLSELRHGPNWLQLTSIQNRQYKMAAQVNFCLFFDVFFLSGVQYDARIWHICVNKSLTYLPTYIYKYICVCIYNSSSKSCKALMTQMQTSRCCPIRVVDEHCYFNVGCAWH